MENLKLLDITLNLFDGASSSGSSGGTGSTGSTSGSSGDTGVKTGETIVYGKQASSDAESKNNKPEDAQTRKDKFKHLITTEYKDLYDANLQDIVKRRVKDAKTVETKLNTVTPILNTIATRYGVDPNDIAAISNAVETDDSFYEAAASEAGLTVEQYRQFERMNRENAQFKKIQQQQLQQQKINEIQGRWANESEQLKQSVSDFNFEVECKDPQFVKLLQSGIDVSTAYKACHLNDIVGSAVETAKKNVTDNIKAKGMRPQENGASNGSGVVIKNDVSKLTRKDRKNIAKRVQRGEQITF